MLLSTFLLLNLMTFSFFLTECIRAYSAANDDQLPDRIMLFRDGVGEGQLTQVYKVELKQLVESLADIYNKMGRDPPKFTFVVVNKKINTRIIADFGEKFDNPPPGTIVDDVITIPDR
jgi:aubergine-like protein